MRKPIIVGNWKLNKTIAEAVEFVTAVEPLLHHDADCGVATSYLALQASVANAKNLIIAAQNVNENDSGAFTGEVSVGMLKEVGVKWVILGHSERRQYYGETDVSVNAKTLKAVANGLTPIVCVGELLEEFEAGKTEEVVRRQTKAALAGLTAEQVDILKDKYGIYLVRSGRMCAAGLNLNNIDYVAESIAEVIKATA